ncbi:four helix bundle protein [Hymenobacter sp. BRD128]|uniref:four helix bundle protein n=1 Tax=Hymenobacter sp. BRD128 TaxID=2675878 RepID=UPI001563C694|nr:four helix bundle protein [Hymenobacter sp. BRD128]QKG56038.1 four helix bundle protein [Hymenobacter sp. BRD128]
MKSENLIADRSFAFALRIIEVYKLLAAEREYVLSKQLLRSGTSTGANIAEANAAVSKREFAAKMAISFKEARETRYWLKLIAKGGLTQHDLRAEIQGVEQLLNMLTAIVKTTQASLG